jgi:hypothetical protein
MFKGSNYLNITVSVSEIDPSIIILGYMNKEVCTIKSKPLEEMNGTDLDELIPRIISNLKTTERENYKYIFHGDREVEFYFDFSSIDK